MRPPVVILGMHRSGTTLLAQALSDLGVFMGYRLDANHEARFFRKLNDWALRQANASWDYPIPFLSLRQFQLEHIERVLRGHTQGLRRIEFLGPTRMLRHSDISQLNVHWGWKDPRNTFLLDIWSRVFPRLKGIHIYRHPLDVASSLLAREERCEKRLGQTSELRLDEFRLTARPLYGESVRVRNIDEGVALWREYLEKNEELAAKLGENMLEIRFETFLEAPQDTLREIVRFLKLKVSQESIEKIVEGIDPGRRFAFLESSDLREKYHAIRDLEVIRKLDYHDLI